MNVSGVTAAGSYTSQQSQELQFSSQDFMKLLIAQLQNQDPLDPMNSQEFLAQLAQLESVATLNELHQTVQGYAQIAELLEPVGLVGRTVRWKSEEGSLQDGVVEAVRLGADQPIVVVQGQEIDLTQIVEVF